MNIRKITFNDFKQFFNTFKTIVKSQESYAFNPNISFDDAYHLWCEIPLETYVYEKDGKILASYYLKPNAQGPASHICNCGYMVSSEARGQGIAKILCEHSQKIAINNNFRAMQFNAVVSTNTIAVKLWEKLGFKIIGTIPKGYNHKTKGFVDSYIMYKELN